jgi:tRNA 2-selenouridine synthase
MPIKTSDWEHGAHVGGYSIVIDVRTPAEWEDDHIPGAVNMPVLDHDQRHQVGLTYKKDSFEGRKLGASLIADSISKIIKEHFMDKEQSWKPLIYCWRGGKRSGSLALVLEQIGFQASVLEGGYKAYRAQVQAQLQALPPKLEWRVLTGPTGSGKTEILHHLDAQGHQVLDLEGLAMHRGSVLGSWEQAQPTQKLFEGHLNLKLQNFDPAKPVWVEDEASVIGKIHVPKLLFESMMPATRYEVCLPFDVRIRHLMSEYQHMVDNPDTLKDLLSRLTQHQGHARIAEWHALIDEGNTTELVRQLLVQHYDPANARSIKARLSKYKPGYQTVRISSLDGETLSRQLPAEIFLPADQQTQTITAEEKQLWFHETAHTGFNASKDEQDSKDCRHERRNHCNSNCNSNCRRTQPDTDKPTDPSGNNPDSEGGGDRGHAGQRVCSGEEDRKGVDGQE